MHQVHSSAVWIANRKPNPAAQLRVFAFPCAGAGATSYKAWHGRWPAEIDFLPIQLPGRETRYSEPRYEAMAQLIPDLQSGLLPYFDKPFVFMGHSLGALIAFELAYALQKSGHSGPLHLFPAAYRAPHLPSEHPAMHQLPDAEFIRELIGFGGIPEAIKGHGELLSLVAAIAKPDFKLHETYIYKPQTILSCPITVFGGQEDQYITEEKLAAWQTLTTGRFALHMLPGGHYFLHDHVDFIIRTICQAAR